MRITLIDGLGDKYSQVVGCLIKIVNMKIALITGISGQDGSF